MPTENNTSQPQPEVKRWQLKGFIPGVEGECEAVFRPVVVLASDYDAAQSELAALREDLATAKRNEHNSEVALKAAYERQDELRKVIANTDQTLFNKSLRLTAAEQRNAELGIDAGRYRKLQLWMASNVKEGWQEVEKMGGISAWMSCADMDQYLDGLGDCNVGLCKKPTESGASECAAP